MTEYRYGPRHYHHYYHGKPQTMGLGAIAGAVAGGVVLLGLALGGLAPSGPTAFDRSQEATQEYRDTVTADRETAFENLYSCMDAGGTDCRRHLGQPQWD